MVCRAALDNAGGRTEASLQRPRRSALRLSQVTVTVMVSLYVAGIGVVWHRYPAVGGQL